MVEHYFLENGLQARDSLVKVAWLHYYYDENGVRAINGFYDFAGYRKVYAIQLFRSTYFWSPLKWVAQPSTFDTQTGIQAKDKFIRFSDGPYPLLLSLILVIWL